MVVGGLSFFALQSGNTTPPPLPPPAAAATAQVEASPILSAAPAPPPPAEVAATPSAAGSVTPSLSLDELPVSDDKSHSRRGPQGPAVTSPQGHSKSWAPHVQNPGF